MKRKLVFVLVMFLSLLVVGCGKTNNGTVSISDLNNSEVLSSDVFDSVFDNSGEQRLLVRPENSLVIVKNNKAVDVVNDAGVYNYVPEKDTEYYMINRVTLDVAAIAGKINGDESYEGTVKMQIKDAKKFIESAEFKKIKANEYFNTYLKDSLKKNMNVAINEIVKDKKIAVKDISDDDLNKKLEELIKTEEKNGVELIVNLK